MRDTIYRDDIVKLLKQRSIQLRGVYGDLGGAASGAAKLIMNFPSAQPEQQWIPCSERLPEEKDAGTLKKLGINKRSDYVIATVEVKGERMTATACTYDGAWNWNMKYAFPDFKVVAWMPLPEPYEERREG